MGERFIKELSPPSPSAVMGNISPEGEMLYPMTVGSPVPNTKRVGTGNGSPNVSPD